MMIVMNNADTNRLKLLLPNHVEGNPGPEYKCGWVNCVQSLGEPKSLVSHVIEHILREKQCRWKGCSGYSSRELDGLSKHILYHVFNSKKYIPSLEEWPKFLPNGTYTEDKTNLFWCPRHLRSKLKLLLFDEDFCLTREVYTAANHKAFVKRLSTTNPSLFNQMISDFKVKRQLHGEDWSNVTLEDQSTISFTSHDNNTVEQFGSNVKSMSLNTDTVEQIDSNVKITSSNNKTVEQIGSNVKKRLKFHMYLGPSEKGVKAKRKRSDFESCTPQRPWSINLLKNLSLCSHAIQVQKSIFETMVEKSLVTASNQSFLKLEQDCAKLASFNGCTNGTFVCTIFKCCFNDQEIIYVRYVESGVYIGLMLQKYCQVLKEKYALSDENIFLHNTLTVEDIDEMKAENEKHQPKESRPDRIYKHATEKSIPQALVNLNDFGECSEVKLNAFVIHALPFKNKVRVDTPEQIYLEVNNSPVTCIKTLLSVFRLNKSQPKVSVSKDILSELTSLPSNLMEQSVVLNCLSGDIKRKPYLFNCPARFVSNFFSNTYRATSLRNHTLQLYIQNRTSELFSFFQSYFPELEKENDPAKVAKTLIDVKVEVS